MFYIRKYTQSYWLKAQDIYATGEISAEAVTRDLVAHKNTLSLWRIENLNDLSKQKGFLAFLGSQDNLDTFDIIVFHESELSGFDLFDNDGKTSLESYKSLHTDITNLRLSSLSKFAEIFSSKLYEEVEKKEELTGQIKKSKKDQDIARLKQELESLLIKRFTKKSIKDAINDAIKEKLISENDLPPTFEKILA